MKKMNLFTGKKLLAAGVLGLLVTLGADAALAVGENAAVDAAGAEEIALADADVTADQAERLHTEAEREDGEAVYEVSFKADGVEYEYQIREADGTILQWEIDGRDIGDVLVEQILQAAAEKADDAEAETENLQDAGTLIGMERAKEVALSDAGMDAADVSFTKIKYEIEKRAVVYEVEFTQDRQEYEYTIDAYTGEVLRLEYD